MLRIRSAILAMASVVVLAESARADALWFDPPLTTPITQGQWFFGVGAIGGVYRAPDWRSTFEIFRGTTSIGGHEFSSNNFMLGPGGTIGYTFRDGTLPPWVGSRARIAFSGMYWSGDRTQSQSTPFAAADFGALHTVDGRVFFNAPAGTPAQMNETLRTEFSAYELALRLTADRPLTPTLTLLQSVGVFGGSSIERYQSNHNFVAAGVIQNPALVNERVVSSRIGADVGVGLAWQVMPMLRWGIGGRAGFHWVRSNLEASDCFTAGATSTACSFSQGTFLAGVAFATTTSSSRSTVGFRGSVGSSLTLDGGWIQAQIGGYFTFDSASPGVVNPSSGRIGTAGNVGAARIRFTGGYNAGGFFTVRVPFM